MWSLKGSRLDANDIYGFVYHLSQGLRKSKTEKQKGT